MPKHDVDPELRTPRVLFAQGELNHVEEKAIESFLAQLGMRASLVSKQQWDTLAKLHPVVLSEVTETDVAEPFSFAGIKSRSDYLVREHFDNFRINLHPEMSENVITRVFHELVDGQARSKVGRGYYRQPGDENLPWPYHTIRLKTRDELGLVPYSPATPQTERIAIYLAQYAIEAGSIIDSLEVIQQARGPKSTSLAVIAATELCLQLNAQIQAAE